MVDNVDPQFCSIYAKHQDGWSAVVADASLDKLDEIKKYANYWASAYGLKLTKRC
jgi:hypothetical protein